MAEVLFINRYDRHCLDKLMGTSTELRLREEGHVFTLSDGTEFDFTESSVRSQILVATGSPPLPPAAPEPEEEPLP